MSFLPPQQRPFQHDQDRRRGSDGIAKSVLSLVFAGLAVLVSLVTVPAKDISGVYMMMTLFGFIAAGVGVDIAKDNSGNVAGGAKGMATADTAIGAIIGIMGMISLANVLNP